MRGWEGGNNIPPFIHLFVLSSLVREGFGHALQFLHLFDKWREERNGAGEGHGCQAKVPLRWKSWGMLYLAYWACKHFHQEQNETQYVGFDRVFVCALPNHARPTDKK